MIIGYLDPGGCGCCIAATSERTEESALSCSPCGAEVWRKIAWTAAVATLPDLRNMSAETLANLHDESRQSGCRNGLLVLRWMHQATVALSIGRIHWPSNLPDF